jgi:paraquat-inducible protein A
MQLPASPAAELATELAANESAGDISPAHPAICQHCGLLQHVPRLVAPAAVACAQCHVTLRRVQVNSLGRALAFSLTGLALFGLACFMPLMRVSTSGIILGADIFSGPRRLDQQGVWELALVVLFTTVAAPFLKLSGISYVLLALRLKRPPAHLGRIFGWVAKLSAWSMVEVYLLGVFVAYVKLVDIVHIDVGIAVYALVGLMVATIATDAFLDRQAVWDVLERKGIVAHPQTGGSQVPANPGTGTGIGTGTVVSCETCEKVSVIPAGSAGEGRHECPRCGSRLHARKPNGIMRCWALVIMVPMLKLAGLALLLLMTQLGRGERLHDRGRLYRIVSVIGRWSMIDIFMESILVALVQFGAIVTIEPGVGAVAFAAVVILTIFAAESFDPRLMWDAAARPGRV